MEQELEDIEEEDDMDYGNEDIKLRTPKAHGTNKIIFNDLGLRSSLDLNKNRSRRRSSLKK